MGFILAVTQACERAGIDPPERTGGAYQNAMAELASRGIISRREIAAARRLEKIYMSDLKAQNPAGADRDFSRLYYETARELAESIVKKILTAGRDGSRGGANV